ncbi:hypothetical protein Tco_1212979 [Tanacetum coccineum]
MRYAAEYNDLVSSVEQDKGIVEQHPATVEETRAYFESLYNNLAIEVEKINALHLSSAKTITTLNEEIANLNNQLSKEKSTVSFLNKVKKKLKSEFKIREDELLDKQIQLENKIKELDDILVKTDEILPIVNQVNARVQNFEIQFLKEAAKFVRDFKSLAKEDDESLAKHKALEFKIEHHLRVVVSQDIMSIMQNPTVVETSDLTKNAKNANTTKFRTIKLIMTCNKISNGCKLSWEISRVKLSDKVSKQKDTTKGTSVNTQFCKQLILGKPPSSSGSKLYSVTPFPKSKGLPKIDESHALSKPVTSNSVPTLQESKVMKNDKMIAPGMFMINPYKTSREDKFMPINKVRASGVDNTAKTRSCIKNKEVEVEEHHRNLLLSKNKKHMLSECNNVKLVIRNDKSEVVCAMCKQCLITANHDVCVLNYVNGMNSRIKKQKGPKKDLLYLSLRNLEHSLGGHQLEEFLTLKEKIIASSESECQSNCLNGDNACCSKHMTGNLKLLINFVLKFLGTILFGNDHVSAIMGYGDLQ